MFMPEIPFEIIAFLFAFPMPLLLVLINMGFSGHSKNLYRPIRMGLILVIGAVSISVIVDKALQGTYDAVSMLALGAFLGLAAGLWIESKVRDRNQ
jgi:hypothetical protein